MVATKEAILDLLGQFIFGALCLISAIAILFWPVVIFGYFWMMAMGFEPRPWIGIGFLAIIASWAGWIAIFILSRNQVGDVTWRRTAKIVGVLAAILCAVYSPVLVFR